jgi:uncharacterized protein (DUF1778 family)
MTTAVLARGEKKERLGFRATREVKELVEQAANLQGVTVSDFLIATACKEATQIINENEVIRLNRQASVQLVEMLMNPAAPNASLRALMSSEN